MLETELWSGLRHGAGESCRLTEVPAPVAAAPAPTLQLRNNVIECLPKVNRSNEIAHARRLETGCQHGSPEDSGRQANESGDIEEGHHRFKRALDRAFMLRGSRGFVNIEEYQAFLAKLFDQLNSGRKEKLVQEMEMLRPLPPGVSTAPGGCGFR